jgi:hypothetical protein
VRLLRRAWCRDPMRVTIVAWDRTVVGMAADTGQRQVLQAQVGDEGRRRRDSWLRRWRRSGSEQALRRDALRRLDLVRAVLERSRAIVASGWVQERWYGTAPRLNQAVLPVGTRADTDPVAAACVLGAVALAVRERDPRADLTVDAGPVVDFLWDAVREARGLPGPGVAGRAAPRELRVTRMREIVRWNDQPGRSRDEVLGVLDLAVSRVIMAAVRQPVGTAA